MPRGGYLSDRAVLSVPLFVALLVFSAVVLALPYETVYVRDEAYLHAFLVAVVLCVGVFAVGTVLNMLVWMQGAGLTGSAERRLVRSVMLVARTVLSRRFARVLSVFLKDALYLSRLRGRSASRWLMHLMILGGFVLMFALDLVVTLSLDVLRYGPMMEEGGWAKLWLRDFGFDLVGLMMLVGLCMAAVRRFLLKPDMVRTELPDVASIVFLLAVVLGGFVLEGMGIAGSIPGHTSNVEYSFVGYALSIVMPASAGEWYDAAWLVHGVMSALLIAYIPFSKLFHMIASPIAIELDGLASSREVGRR
jgi:hypothetical protein